MICNYFFQILPHDMVHNKGGQELLSDMDTLTARVNEFRAEQRQKNQISTLPRTEDSLIPPPSASETKGLLRPSPTKNNSTTILKKDESLKVALESGVLSLNDQAFKDRDKSVNPDLV